MTDFERFIQLHSSDSRCRNKHFYWKWLGLGLKSHCQNISLLRTLSRFCVTLSINPIFFICLLVRPSTTVLVSLLMWPLGKTNGWPLPPPPPSLDQKTEWAAKSDNNEEAWWEVKRRPAPYQDCWAPVGRQGWLQWRLHKRGGGQRGWLDYVIGLCKAGFKRDNASFGVCWWCVYARAKW